MSAITTLIADMQARFHAIHDDADNPSAVRYHVAVAQRELQEWEADNLSGWIADAVQKAYA